MSSIDAQDDPVAPKAQSGRNKEVWVSVPEKAHYLCLDSLAPPS